ncbi:(2Fe-2S) ferredoxin domain-containing protein [Clostridium omnivorum]|uniref:NADH dehydrogenase n=1 Tax=Clostridium omnivorum TaxID=1604902 RepID=A0ABQ5N7D2_9CLOT|nr:(2Fe-2S) ferredoxin domain-containing protein [Clostridium sp. E14]GLC31070.1 NADH dehydrogenase [Clostridium sp. E14]
MVNINVCIGSACHLKGSYNVIKGLQKCIDERDLSDKVRINGSFCLGHCTNAVSVQVNGGQVVSVSEQTVEEFLNEYVIPIL